MDIENSKNEIKNSTKKGLTKEIKNLLCLSIDKWIEIEKIFKIRPNILFSNNLEIDNNILFEYPIQSIKNIETLDPTFKKILNMFGQDTIKNIEQIINLSTSDSNRTNIRSLKDKLARRAKKCFTNIFKNFTVNVIPEIVIDDQIFQIIIRGKENRYFSTSETIYQSSGFKAFLWLIIMLEVVKDWDKNRYGRTILLVDEPDKSLHILLQYELANYLKLNFTNNNNVFILMTSHSPFLIPNLNENIYIADMNEEGKTTLIKAKNVNNIRNSGIFPLITLFHMEKLRDELFENIKEDLIRIYFENQKNDDLNKKIENFIHKTWCKTKVIQNYIFLLLN
ncbi:AAA family ATPase [Spiroplasma endosymbiont of Zeiraphera isertana]|uniref:AAA family ATPase n=1 Tax=Spiroplasma endosymbiont of Zeiraphera isertana TaxID=3066313 RepID=UPI00313E736A